MNAWSRTNDPFGGSFRQLTDLHRAHLIALGDMTMIYSLYASLTTDD